jgi:hypothetical protein
MHTVTQTIRFAKELKLDYVQFSKCLAKPLTPLWRQMVEKTGVDYWRDWVLGKETDRDLPRPWTALTNEEIDCLAKRAYVSYHLQPRFLFRAACKVQSFSEFKRKFFALLDMIFTQEEISTKDEKFIAYHEEGRKLDFYIKMHGSG